MPRTKPQTIRIRTWVPDRNCAMPVEIELPLHFRAEVRKTVEGSALTLTYYEQACVLRERAEGTIECEAAWIRTKSGRQRTGTHNMGKAIEWAARGLREAHEAYLDRGRDESGRPVATSSTLRLSEADALLRRRNLLPGAPGSKKQAPYDLVLCIARTVWAEDPVLADLNKSHIRRMYEARLREDCWAEVFGRDAPRTLQPFSWPAEFAERARVSRVKPQTIQGDLTDLQTALQSLVGEPNGAGGVFLEHNPLRNLDLGEYEKDRREMAGPDRYPNVIRYADDANEVLRTEGRHWTERRMYRYKDVAEWRTYQRSERLDCAPGMLRMALVIQFGHPTRPASWRRIRVEDCARTRAELVRVISTLRLREGDHPIPQSYADVWIHGAIRYRREDSKLGRERLVPMSGDILDELSRYLTQREEWLARRAEYEGRPELIESSWLFPSPRDPMEPLSETDQNRLIGFGESFARQRLEAEGLDPDELVPELHKTAWYGYRRWWKTIRNAIGWEGNFNAAYVGDWSIRSGATADVVYARLSPHLILACVEGKTLVEAIAEDPGTDAYKVAARISPDSNVRKAA